MKRIILFLVATLLIFAGCKKDDDTVFDQSPDVRLNDALTKYQSELSGAQYGWKALLFPQGGGAYFFYIKFNDANRVQMISDFDSASALTVKESSYRLKALQQPSLIFDTYSYIHLLSDPDASINGGAFGQGLLSDFEFYFNDSTSADTLKLTGRMNGSRFVMTKATEAEANAFTSGQLKTYLFKNDLGQIQQYFKRFTIGTSNYDVNVDLATKKIIFTWTDGQGNVLSYTTTFYFTLNGIALEKPFVDGSTVISEFTDFSFSSSTSTINLNASGTAASIKGVSAPIVVDKDAPRRWRQYSIDNSLYWISLNGFHVNGVDDAFGVNTLSTDTSNFYYLIYWAQPGGQSYDIHAPVFLNRGDSLDINYGIAQRANLLSDGRVTFRYVGDLLAGPFPTTGPAVLTRDQLLSPQGYYLVQTGPITYDMVSAADSRIWITWLYPF